ncbi:hypothetical protein LshimejAT787_2000400 [Lyophyllum shimeji]|uniref:Tc1-like transposase DDE domain-containing protein n=1 Tax=Lyophyllum shimeji TaxID=47721 RepID=A0A9P3PY10_LYOSH|nr:hypothetical protein LshimejAT787_2000400 [Lyophyllum shimeji]
MFLREFVVPLTNPYPGPRSVLILDNCSIHHAEEVRQLMEDEASCRLIFLHHFSRSESELNKLSLRSRPIFAGTGMTCQYL